MKINYETYWDNKSSHAYHPSVRLRNTFIINTLKKLSFHTLLDVGCGDGHLLSLIHTYFPTVQLTGFDYSHAVIERNKKKYNSILFESHDLGKALSINKTYDVVVCSEVIEHIDEREKVIENLVACTNPGGYIILTTQAGHRYPSDIENGHLKHFVLQELNNGFLHHGCKVLFSYRKGFPFYDMQKYVHSKILKTATSIQEGKLTLLKKVLFGFVYRLFILTPRTKTLGTQIYTMYQKNL